MKITRHYSSPIPRTFLLRNSLGMRLTQCLLLKFKKLLHSADYAQNNITHNSCMPHVNVSVGQLPEQVLRNFWSLQEGMMEEMMEAMMEGGRERQREE